ncbi:MAG: hypothetical protein EOO40_11710 [Deltaproteobacteria bacterium]|nr:MAG: hypothetical protein EOO40_11710 [Deltaproteobacteria bacterium]
MIKTAGQSPTQRWTYDRGGYLFFTSRAAPAKCVFVSELSAGAALQLDDCSTNGTLWLLGAEGFEIIAGDGGGQCVQLADADVHSGTAVELAACSGAATQRWTFDGSRLQAPAVAGGALCLNMGADVAAGVLGCDDAALSPLFYSGTDGSLRPQAAAQSCLTPTAADARGLAALGGAACGPGSGWTLAP